MTAEYPEVEELVAEWLHERIGQKTWADPDLPHNWTFTAPIGQVLASPGEGDSALTLSSTLLDIAWISKDADLAKRCARQTWSLMRLELPGYTWDTGVNVNGVRTFTRPYWAPATGVYKRSATYLVHLHGMVTA